MLTVKLKKGKIKKLKEGHLWIYRRELSDRIPKGIPPGPVVVEDHNGRFFCIGDYNPDSNIAVKILTRKKLSRIDKAFFRMRIQNAYDYRRRIYPDETSYRLIYSEGDFLPGLVVDKYGEYLSVQLLTPAMEYRKEQIYEILIELLSPTGIVERSGSLLRKNENNEVFAKVVYGDVPDKVIIKDGHLRFYVDLINGEKTGYFFDQRINRRALQLFSENLNILDVFTYTGGFAIHAGYYGAAHITAIDISEEAIKTAKENSELNGLSDKITYIVDDAFDYLKEATLSNIKYDLIILDPPAFTKSKESKNAAYRGYKEINLRALKILKPGGLLITSSCSYNFSLIEFITMLKDAAMDARRDVRIVKISGQSPDHPINLYVPETNYLKTVFLTS